MEMDDRYARSKSLLCRKFMVPERDDNPIC